MRRGASLVELIVTMAILCIVLSLVGRTLVGQQRLYRGLHVAELSSRAMQQGLQIVGAELESLSPDDGDMVPGQATDSAVEFMSLIAAGVSCGSQGSTIRLPAALDTAAPALASYVSTLDVGDRLLAWDAESSPEQWRARTIVSVQRGGAACPWAGPLDGYTLILDSPLAGEPMTAIRVARRTRYSLYRAGDRQWYLGMRDWNIAAGRFNTIQPVSGPYLPYNANGSLTGARFSYLDSADRVLGTPVVDATAVWRIEVVVRTANGGDSLARSVALRHAR
jgi:prepilin-type N-terminal cleavage/methylation domain-containing protein